jgi:hypothetical protein
MNERLEIMGDWYDEIAKENCLVDTYWNHINEKRERHDDEEDYPYDDDAEDWEEEYADALEELDED